MSTTPALPKRADTPQMTPIRYERWKCRALKFEPMCQGCRTQNSDYKCYIDLMYWRMKHWHDEIDEGKKGVHGNWVYAPYRPFLAKTLEVWWPQYLDYLITLNLLG